MTSYTPGPWKKDLFPNIRGYSIRAGGKVRAVVMHRDNDLIRNGCPEGQANAQLIAAAPDLLAACEASHNAKTQAELDKAVKMIEAAITKARGEVSQ